MSACTTLGDLRRLVIFMEDQEDGVPVRLTVPIPGLFVDAVSFPGGPRPRPVVLRADAATWSIGQSDGYLPGQGPASHILIGGSVS